MGMFGLPYVNKYVNKVIKEQAVADTVDYLSYYVTSILLATASFFISAKQYFGSPIQCWLPKEFTGSWEKYTENYCFINNMYRVPMNESVPTDIDERGDQLSYYRWVPIALALQSLCFWLPNYLWNMLHKQTAINPRSVVREIRRCKKMYGKDRDKEVDVLATYIDDILDCFHPRNKTTTVRNGWNATFLYIFIKFLYLFNVVVQLLIMDAFLGGGFFDWGLSVVRDIIQGNPWQESKIFPRVIMCDFIFRRLGNKHRHSAQCVIMMNMINEKLYLILYLWFTFLAIVTAISFFNQIRLLCLPMCRKNFVRSNIDNKVCRDRNITDGDLCFFTHQYLHADGILLLQFVREHVGGRATYDLVTQLLKKFERKYSSYESSPSTFKEDYKPKKNFKNKNYKKNLSLTEPDSTYKPTGYGPSSLYPTAFSQNDSSDLDYIDNSTLPVSQAHQRTPIRPAIVSQSPNEERPQPSAPENHYSQLPPKTSV